MIDQYLFYFDEPAFSYSQYGLTTYDFTTATAFALLALSF